MNELAIDIETYSGTDIKAGVHKYVEDPDFEILMIAYKLNDDPIKIIDLKCGEKIPEDFKCALKNINCNILKTAYNAAFEIACLSKHLNIKLDPSQWSCTMALAAQAGYPFGLEYVARVMQVSDQKDSIGKELIKYFSVPCKPTKTNSERTRNLPQHDYSKWLDFKTYCCKDVAAEQAVRNNLKWFTISEFEKHVWVLDQKINNSGVNIDMELVNNAIAIEKTVTAELIDEMCSLTTIKNPKSNKQVKDFIQQITGVEIESLNKAAMPEVNNLFKDTEIMHVLKIREKLSRSSVKKYTAMLGSACSDNKLRGLFQYYGANRTGRWAGRIVQPQNLPRNDLKDLDFARMLVKAGNLTVLKLTYDDAGYVLSQLIRTAFIPAPGKQFIISDFSAIEARIVAWYAHERWRLDVFATHGKIYEASASQMFGVALEKVTKELRTKGKISELALGYQGAASALERMGAVKMGVCDEALRKAKILVESGKWIFKEWNEKVKQYVITEELTKLVNIWRRANPKIVKLWYDTQAAVMQAIKTGRCSFHHSLDFYMKEKNLIIKLPSGRELVYINAKIIMTLIKNEPKETIVYEGMDQTTKQWTRQYTYGGKLIENIVQATARDVLTDALKRSDKAGHQIALHVHDEGVFESGKNVSKQNAEVITKIFSSPIDWAPGLPLAAETFIADYYQK
jgi:DNA polymerase